MFSGLGVTRQPKLTLTFAQGQHPWSKTSGWCAVFSAARVCRGVGFVSTFALTVCFSAALFKKPAFSKCVYPTVKGGGEGESETELTAGGLKKKKKKEPKTRKMKQNAFYPDTTRQNAIFLFLFFGKSFFFQSYVQYKNKQTNLSFAIWILCQNMF